MKNQSSGYLIFPILICLILIGCGHSRKTEPYNENREMVPNPEGYAKDNIQINNSSQAGIDSFKIYLDKFDLRSLPVSFGNNEMNESSNADSTLDTLFAGKFIGKRQVIKEDFSVEANRQYAPLLKFKTGNQWAVVVQYIGGSGGIENEYHLVVYDSSGNIMSNLMVGLDIGDCGFLDHQSFMISSKSMIYCTREYYEGNCETEEMNLKATKKLMYQIEKDGSIKEIH